MYSVAQFSTKGNKGSQQQGVCAFNIIHFHVSKPALEGSYNGLY
jgi:hypothetical protein